MPTVVAKTALVFGADTPVGRECVSRLQQHQVTVCSANHGDLDGKDLEVGWNDIVDRCIAELGHLDAFVCCSPDVVASSLFDASLEAFRRTLNSTALSGWLGQKQAITAMAAPWAGWSNCACDLCVSQVRSGQWGRELRGGGRNSHVIKGGGPRVREE